MASRIEPIQSAPIENSTLIESSEGDDDTDLNTEGIITSLPQKKYYRQRAHVNPLSIQNLLPPVCPSVMKWSEHYPDIGPNCVEFLDIGCGYGGLLISLSTLFADKYILGIEIRIKVMDYVNDRIKSLRLTNANQYLNISVLRTNAMKYLPNYFNKAQLTKLFFLYPDPHFKKSKHKWRIISPSLLAEYAYILQIGGVLYTATDVLEVHEWMKKHITDHSLFTPMTSEELSSDSCIPLLTTSTEEAAKVTRNGGQHYIACFKRIHDPYVKY
ncbi:tRNA (guanine-N(7)-)-methyltransferase B [Oopsacas minuta]|uniref:tRNA (guanine-N(7)-)-methyltransferase n=1 Tax=Oopsacas minuta TaxID=111878 RepID=A0AAV7JMH9_9METZ|nr:tRNA (guanine-N(7)-)-methyltransferase B [Oopsacas minuta]